MDMYKLKKAYQTLSKISGVTARVICVASLTFASVVTATLAGDGESSQPQETLHSTRAINLSVNKGLSDFLGRRSASSSRTLIRAKSFGKKPQNLTVEEALKVRVIVTQSKSRAVSDGQKASASKSSNSKRTSAPQDLKPNSLELFPHYRSNLLNFTAQPKIYYGEFDKENKFPAVVLLPGSGNQDCSGTVVGSNWVITAAHCACRVGFNRVLYGKSKQNSAWIDIAEGPFYFDETICLNGEWKKEYGKRDIALYKLKDDFPGTPSELADLASVSPTEVSIVGFGKTQFNPVGGFKYHTEVPVASAECSSTQLDDKGVNAPDRFNCIEQIELVAASESFKDTCSGDSGGPAFIKTTRNGETTYRLAGVTSRGTEGECGAGGIYVRITPSVAAWIEGCKSGSGNNCPQLAWNAQREHLNISMNSGELTYE